MSSITILPPPSTPISGFFNGNGGSENYDAIVSVSATPPFQEDASTSNETGLSNGVVITVIVFSVTVIVSILLCFLIRLLSKRCARRVDFDEESGGLGRVSSNQSRRRVQVQPVDEVRQQQRDEPSHGLPVITLKSTRPGVGDGNGKSELVSGGECPICLSGFQPKDHLRLLPICCHAFHAECVDQWLESNQSCPLCRSPIFVSESEILRKVLEVEHCQPDPAPTRIVISHPQPIQSSIHSLVRAESENKMDQLAAEMGANRSWLRDYLETLSSRTASFRSSTRYFTGSSRRSEVLPGDGYWDLEASRAGEEISEMFRWFSGI